MSKKSKKVESKKAFAKAKYLSVSPTKMRRVANVVRGKSVVDALHILQNLTHKSARFLYQAIQSAKANAVNTHEMNEAGLVISDLMINEGPRATRYRVRARGRICPIIKKTSHIIVGVKGA